MEKLNQEATLTKLEELGVDPSFIIKESFLGYKYRKQAGKLYTTDSEIPINLIKMYYGLDFHRSGFDTLKTAFINRYIKNESELEGVDVTDIHSKVEIAGLEVMYEYIHSDEIDYMFNIYTLKELHEKLFSLTEFPECAGFFRTFPVYLPGTGTELADWSNIREDLDALDEEVQALLELAPKVREENNMDLLFEYLDRCIILKCKIIKIHPFGDGNGRVTRGFINKLFEYAGLPPTYIKPNERTEYHKAMNIANNEGDYSVIQNFYRYKICDSIIELDINEQTKKVSESASNKVKTKGTY